MRRLAPTSSARERSRVNVSPVLALAGLAAIGLLATRLPRPAWPRVASLDPLLGAGGPLVAVGLVLGPGIGFLSPALLRALAPVMADRKSTRLNSSHRCISYAVFCLK